MLLDYRRGERLAFKCRFERVRLPRFYFYFRSGLKSIIDVLFSLLGAMGIGLILEFDSMSEAGSIHLNADSNAPVNHGFSVVVGKNHQLQSCTFLSEKIPRGPDCFWTI